jgi:crotonobetainyl-CoA:carnitine CoA-transferase CaiB-like acyl-CoA transferase
VLGDIRIVELAEGLAGPMAALRLGDLGASVTKIEPQRGDWMRGAQPEMADGTSAAFFALNRNKRSFATGSVPSEAASLLLKLLARADVFITDRTDADLRALGIGAVLEPNSRDNPGLIVASVSDWGPQGPWAGRPGSELAAQAMAGYTRYLGSAAEPPERLGADVGGAGAAMFTVQAVLAALLWRRRQGKGQRVSTSVLNSLMSMKSIQLAAQSNPDQYSGPRVGGPYDPPERGWKTSDRPIFFAFGGSVGAAGRPGWSHFVDEIGLSHLKQDKRLDENGRNSTGHGSLVHAMREVYETGFAKRKAEELVATVRKYGANVAMYMRADETLAHPQTKALEIEREVKGPVGPVNVRAFPARFSRSSMPVHGGVPRLGEHTDEVAAECGLSAAEITELRTKGGLA